MACVSAHLLFDDDQSSDTNTQVAHTFLHSISSIQGENMLSHAQTYAKCNNKLHKLATCCLNSPEMVLVNLLVISYLSDGQDKSVGSTRIVWLPCERSILLQYVHIDFSQEEWASLNPSQKSVYKDVMLNTYINLNAVGKTEFSFMI